jgi:hypothetical protein
MTDTAVGTRTCCSCSRSFKPLRGTPENSRAHRCYECERRYQSDIGDARRRLAGAESHYRQALMEAEAAARKIELWTRHVAERQANLNDLIKAGEPNP